MKYSPGLAALLLVFGPLCDAQAQFGFFPVAPTGFAFNRGIGFNYHRNHLNISGFARTSYFGYGYPGPFFGFANPALVGNPFFVPPAFVGNPFFAPQPFFGNPFFIPPAPNITIISNPAPIVVVPPIVINQVVPARNQEPANDAVLARGNNDFDQFARIMPRKRPAPENNLAAGKAPPAARPNPAVAAKVKPAEPPPIVKPPQIPSDDPSAATAFQLDLGRQAFAAQQYGRAESRFLQATQLAPKSAQGHFLLAQAQFARAQYREAVESIHTGLRLLPNWPNEPFRPQELYLPNSDDYNEQLRRLEDTLTRFPNDPMLLFLAGYQRWFGGPREDARVYLQRAAIVADNRAFIDLFLRDLPPVRVVQLPAN